MWQNDIYDQKLLCGRTGIAEELEEDPAVIDRICKAAAGFAPDYDEEKICADVLKEFQMNFWEENDYGQ